ncbi:DUF202 domain-containing protein [Pseudonocardia spinosispora]|uniref:DUF202 domain-containing protein n=1 Tax=Pseudonocardia spinosispora TaxID=103441 RepID=UPI0004099676|nr:DUF202 domain-containing protein [Pseudonocardia spinosispora]
MTTVNRHDQPARTALAWQRTALLAATNAVLLMRDGYTRDSAFEILAALCLAALVVLATVVVRIPSMTGCSRRTIRAATGLVIAAGALTAIGLLT